MDTLEGGFQVGDKVRYKAENKKWTGGHEVVTVSPKSEGGVIYAEETDTWASAEKLELVPEVEKEGPESPEGPDYIDPPHYTKWKIQPKTFIMQNHLSFEIGNIVKYAVRAGHKLYPNKDHRQSEIADLQKVIDYAEERIEMIATHEERAVAEHKALSEKFEKLDKFLNSKDFVNLPNRDIKNLGAQHLAMRDYLNALENRISNFDNH